MTKEIWTEDQVKSANEFQQSGCFHPFTCGNEKCRDVLKATKKGWVCPSCDYTQDWAHEWMLNDMWKKMLNFNIRKT